MQPSSFMRNGHTAKRDSSLLIAGGITLAVGLIAAGLVVAYADAVLGCIHSILTLTNQDLALIMFAFGFPLFFMIGIVVLWSAGIAVAIAGIVIGATLIWNGLKTEQEPPSETENIRAFRTKIQGKARKRR